MTRTKLTITIVIIIIFALGGGYAGLNGYTLYKSFQDLKQKINYELPEGIPNSNFIRGEWEGILIDKDINVTDGAHNIIPYDIDRDGKIELIANSYRADSLMIYKCHDNPRNPADWSRYIIDSSCGGAPRRSITQFIIYEKLLGGFSSGAHYTAIADINGDGRDDLIVACDRKQYNVVWYETPKDITDISAWQKHIVCQEDPLQTYHLDVGDVDNDGDIDIVGACRNTNVLYLAINEGDGKNWNIIYMDRGPVFFNARVADLNNDGQKEIIATDMNGKLYLYLRTGDPTTPSWSKHTISSFLDGPCTFELKDIDLNQYPDIIVEDYSTAKLYLLRNPYPADVRSEWTRCLISDDCDAREIAIGDINSDGYLDIVVADEGDHSSKISANSIVWFENDGTTFYQDWKRHKVDQSDVYLYWCHCVELGDIDGDGNLDIAVSAAASNVFMCYFRNQ